MNKSIYYIIGVMFIMTLCIQNTEAAFSSTYVPSNFFSRIQVDATIPDDETISWTDIHFINHLIIKNESIWYKNNKKVPDNMGITFVCFIKDCDAIVNDLRNRFIFNGVTNITVNKYEVPTIELSKSNDYKFSIFLQNQDNKPKQFIINLSEGKKFLVNPEAMKTYTVPSGTISDKYPVDLILRSPANMSIGQFDDFVYMVSEPSQKSTNGSITPTIPFTKRYKVFIVDNDKPDGLKILNPTNDEIIRKTLGDAKINIEWQQVIEPNFLKYQLLVSNNSKYSKAMNFTFNGINKTEQEVSLEDLGGKTGIYYIQLKAVDSYGNFAEEEIAFTYEKMTIEDKTNVRNIVIVSVGVLLLAVMTIVMIKRRKSRSKPTLNEGSLNQQTKQEVVAKEQKKEDNNYDNWEL
jgi:hypothetical protein